MKHLKKPNGKGDTPREEHKCDKSKLYTIIYIESKKADDYCIAFNGAGWYLDPGDYGVKIDFCPFCGEEL